MTLHSLFIFVMAAATFVVLPIVIFWAMIDFVRGSKGKNGERHGGGGISNLVGGAMMELDRFVRPSVEHTIETERPTLRRDDDSGGD